MSSVPARLWRAHARRSMVLAALAAVLLAALLPIRPALAAPILVLNLELAPGTPQPIDTGVPFRYRLTYECSGSLSTDICEDMVVTTDPLPGVLEGLQAVGNGDVSLASFDTATRRATWAFRSPLPPGTTGQLEFEVRFVPGTTVDGTTGGVTATISATGLTPVSQTSPPTTSNATDQSSVAKVLETGGAAADVSTYRIDVCTGGDGGLAFSGGIITDTLPLGATYVSSSPTATTVNTAASPQVVTWSGLPTIPANGCGAYRVTVNYPTPANNVGDAKSNSVQVSGTPFGGALKTMSTTANHTLAAPAPGIDLDKTADADTIIGGTIDTTLRVRNTGNTALQGVTLDDPIPPEHMLQSIDTGAAQAVAYQKNGGAIWFAGVVTGTNVLVSAANFPGLLPGDYVSGLRFTIGDIPVAFDSSGIRLHSTVVNPPNGGGASYTLPHNVTNTATVSAVYGGVPLSDRQDGATTEVDVPKARPTPIKSIVSGSPALPGDLVRYRLTMNNGSFRALDEPVLADLLPAEVTYVAGSWALERQITGCAVPPTFQTVANYGGSGRTLLLWSWAGTACSIPTGDDARITFDVQVRQGVYPTSALPNRFALVNFSTPTTLVRTGNCAAAPAEAALFTTSAATGVDAAKLCWSPPTNLRINAAASVASAKLVRGQLDAGFHRDPNVGATVQGGLITYSMALTNTGNVDFRTLQMVDILPYNDPPPGNRGVRDMVALGTAWTPQLAGPVVVSPAIPGLTVRYSTETNPCRPELASPNPGCTPMVDDDDPGPGIWSLNLPTDPTAVRSLKFDFGSYVLRAGENVTFTFPMFAPIDAPVATLGTDGLAGTSDDGNVAWNTFAYSAVRVDDGSRLVAQPPRVGIEVQATPSNRASFGDYVWNDVDQDGLQDEPAFRGINGVSVRLYQDADGSDATTGDRTLIGTTVTRNDGSGNPGYYLFPALVPGSYLAEIVPPPGYTVTPRDAAAEHVDSDADPATGRTAVVTLAGGTDHRDTDMGVYAPVVSVGNRVWFDTDNDGSDDDGPGGTPGSGTGIAGVAVELFQDTNGDGGLTGAERQAIAFATTDAGGFYRFDAQTHVGGTALGSPTPLYPGSYIVGIAPSNFAAAGALRGTYSSGSTADAAGLVTDAAAVDPDLGTPPNPGADRDENGDAQPAAALFYAGGVLSKAVAVNANEPLAEPEPAGTAPGGIAVADNRSNLTVDFGFYTVSVGDVVWLDDGAGGGGNNNALRDGAEAGLAGATVRLFAADGTTEIRVGPDGALGTADDAAGGVTTGAAGAYRFSGLAQGSYLVRVTPPAGFASSRDIASTPAPDGNVNGDDNGVGSANGAAASQVFVLQPGDAGALANNTVTAADGSTDDPTVDFSFVRSYSLGNRVWRDLDNSGHLTAPDGAAPGIGGVTLRLFLADGATRAATIGGATVPDATTDASGYYRFDNLPAGDYLVEVQSANFGGALGGLVSSTGGAQSADPDDDAETDDNGLDTPVAGAIRSGVVTLGEGAGTAEPITDADGGGIAPAESPDAQSNRTVDFGFFEPMSLGNRVWDDADNNGQINGAEAGMSGVTVRLYADANNDDAPDDVNGGGVDTSDALATTTTNATGHYLFTMLLPGTYLVEIEAPAGYRTSTGNFNSFEPAPDADANASDSDDNGSAVAGVVVRSRGVTLSLGGEPLSEAASTGLVDPAADRNANLAVDFGLFRPVSLGNRVWNDTDNSGTINGAEIGIDGVTVRLYRDSNNDNSRDDVNGGGVSTADAIQTAITSSGGYYLFTGLGADTYIVEVVTPAGYRTSTGRALPNPYENAPDPDTVATDSDDNGTASSTVVRSRGVTLSVGGEPTGEGATPGWTDDAADNSSNVTVDFGFFEQLSLGNRVWLDADNDGSVDAGESGISGVTVRLYRDSNTDGLPDDLNGIGGVTTADVVSAAVTTNGTGYYLFTGLDADTYIVEVVTPAGHRSSTGVAGAYEPAPDPDTLATDSDDNGTTAGSVTRSAPVTLTVGGEPTGEGATPGLTDTAADNRSNVTVDFGFWRPVNLGNLVFEDGDNSGVFGGASDRPLAGATVTLFFGDGTTPATDVNGAAVAPQTTVADGLYSFTNLLPGDYVVTVTAPAGYRSSTDVAGTTSPNGNVDGDDNGEGVASAVSSRAVTITTGGEPDVAADTDATDGNLTVDFGFWHPVSLGNLVWEDRDNSGTYSALTDVPLAGATVTLFLGDGTTPATDVNGAAVAPQTTVADGLYSFTNLRPGDYVVRVAAPAGYRSSTDVASTGTPNGNQNDDDNGPGSAQTVTSAAINLASGSEPGAAGDGDDVNGNTTLDFGFFRPVSLGNLVWEDRDNSGAYDSATEQPLAGATVTLFLGDGTTPATDVNGAAVAPQTTVADGLYSFTNLRPGDYVVRVVAPAGYRSSTDVGGTGTPNGNQNDDDNGVGVAATVSSPAITLSTGGEPAAGVDGDGVDGNTTLDFGFFRPVNLGNLVWEDRDNSGAYDSATEQPLAGATVTLFLDDGTTPATDVDGAAVAPQTTVADGLYSFTNLRPGDYVVRVAAPAGYRSSTDVAGTGTPNGNQNDDDNGPGSAQTVTSQPISLIPGDEPAAGVDGDGVDGNTTLDFGFFRPVSLGNLVWEDRDNSGTYSALTDVPLAGATVTLFFGDGTTPATDVDGAAVAPQTTVADGLYSFTNLRPGDYVVRVAAPAGYRSSTDVAGTGTPNGNQNDDDNGPGSAQTVTSQPISLIPGDEPAAGVDGDGVDGNTTLDFGFFRPVSLGNLVWEDRDDSGTYSALTDVPLAGATVTLFLGDGTTPATDVDGAAVAPQTTGVDGLYGFTNLLPGDYVVRVAAPAGYRSSSDVAGTTSPNGNQNDDDNGPGSAQTVTSAAITLTTGGEPGAAADGDGVDGNTTLDFGFFRPVSLGNLVWEDRNNSGAYDSATEQPLAGATVTLFLGDGTTPATDVDGAAVAPQVTGVDGLYGFTNLLPGDYVVRVAAPAGYRSSTDLPSTLLPNSNTDGDDSGEGVAATVSSRAITLSTGDEPGAAADGDGVDGNTTLDFGFFTPLRLGNLVWEDRDDSGAYDSATEQPLAGATVALFESDGTTPATNVDGAAVPAQVTGVDGLYLFTNLLPGDYIVRVTAPAGYRSSTDVAGTTAPNGDLDGDDNGEGRGASAASRAVTLVLASEPGAATDGDDVSGNLTLDFGFLLPASIGDRVWLDLDRDGMQGLGDNGVPGVTVTLLRPGTDNQPGTADDVTVSSTTTGATGDYLFDDLPAGDYFLQFGLPAGYSRSAQDQGADDAADSDADVTSGRTVVTTLVPGEADTSWDSGLHYTAALGDRVWLDRDANGSQNAGEPGVPGVTVNLLDSTDTVVATTTTDGGGFYGFPHLPPGDYRVEFVPPAEYVFSPRDVGIDSADSDVDPFDGRTATTNIVLGETDPSWDAGLYRPVSLGDLVWNDVNNDGAVTAGEPGMPGVTVELYRDDDGDGLPSPSELVVGILTDAGGRYEFVELIPAEYIVVLPAGNFATGGPLERFVSSTGRNGSATGPAEPAPDPDGDRNDDDSGTRRAAAVVAQPVLLTTGMEPVNDGDISDDSNWSVDFGVYLPASIGRIVWYDTDRDGARDPGEGGTPGVTVTLHDGTGSVVASTTTDRDGAYQFTNLTPGSYRVEFESVAGFQFTAQNQGDDTVDSDVDPGTGMSATVVLVPGDSNMTVYAGLSLIPPTAITLERFTAAWQDGAVLVEWTTSAESNTWGYHLLRSSTGRRADAEQVTAVPLLARGRGAGGATYRWTDTSAEAGASYTYWLVEIELSGTTAELGPAATAPGTAGDERMVFLPLVRAGN